METALSVLAFCLSLISLLVSVRQFRQSAVRQMRPVLVFAWTDKGWMLQNVGTGPATSVLVASSDESEQPELPVRLPPLAVGASFACEWEGAMRADTLFAGYTDAEGRPYTTKCVDDLCTLHVGWQLPHWELSTIAVHWDPPAPRRMARGATKE